jgi:L-ascorbate metabolism protein UlaG (beta-lactamase superfamily)
MNTIRYLGHTSFEMLLGDAIAYVNPSVSDTLSGNRRKQSSALTPSIIKHADLIFVTSEDEQYCEPALIKEISERTFASVVAPKPALAKIDISEKFKVDVRVGDKFTIKGIDVEVIRANHPQSAYPVGFLIKKDGLSIYHAGATYAFSDMSRIHPDIALLPIGGGQTMDTFAANAACRDMRPKFAVPMHYNTYEKIEQDVTEFTSDLGTITRPVVLRVGEAMRL